MSNYPVSRFADNLPAISLIAAAKGAAGFGLGLLVADRLNRDVRQRLGIASIALGVALVLPFAAGVVSRVNNRPGSRRGMRRRLESIRDDSGFAQDEEVV